MGRYRRNEDPYQTTDGLRELYALSKRAALPEGASDDEFRKLFFAVQYAERFPKKTSRTGRRARFSVELLFGAAARMHAVLERETGGRISLLRFVSTYFPSMSYPNDPRAALEGFRINLEEARMLARITRTTLGDAVKRRAADIRKDLIESHLKRQGTQAELKRRVDERLRLTPRVEARTVAVGVATNDSAVDVFLEFDEFDTEHLLWEEMKGLVYLMREVDATLVDDETTERVLQDLDAIKLRLLKFRRRTPENGDLSA